jgi:hypothetical protein
MLLQNSMRNPLLILIPLLCPLCLFAADLNPPVPINASKIDRTRISGRITRYDDESFTYTDRQNDTLTIKWTELDPANDFSVHERLFAKATPQQWLSLAKRLNTQRNGKVPADKAFARALRLDPNLKEKIDALKRGEGPDPPATNPTTRAASQPAATSPSSSTWGALTEPEQLASIQQSKAYADEVRQKLAPRLAVYETKYFLFASDLQQAEAQRWAAVLDRMYARLSELFAVPKDTNIWRGKALVLVFAERDTYNKFEQQYFESDASKTGGRCHASPNGDVKIAFYRAADDQWFSHVLVHESTHGFLHRYRSPIHIPSWINEGLAEYVAYDLVPHAGLKQAAKNEARADLQVNKNLSDLFSGNTIENHRYATAFMMTQYLIETNKKSYITLINAIKDGDPAPDAFQKSFQYDLTTFAQKFGEAMNVHDLTTQTNTSSR